MNPDAGSVLLPIARAAISRALGLNADASEAVSWLEQPGASFVTLLKAGELRGCVGSLEPRRPLLDDVKSNALAAAFRDPRFPSVTRDELDAVRVEVSLLSEPSPIEFENEDDVLFQLQPFEDGVVLECSNLRGTFLPQVWEMLPDPGLFLRELKRKTGLPLDFWSREVRLLRYRVMKFTEDEVRREAALMR